jgi:glycosyltransferase involved in cell wall biosynthesis
MSPASDPLVNLTTVPRMLRCLSGQPAFMGESGFEVRVISIEAASVALPVVATRAPGSMNAIQDGVTGTLVGPRDSQALADPIRHYLRDPVLRLSHGDAGRARVLKEFRREELWEAMRDEYRSSVMSRLSLPQPRSANVSSGSGSPL